MSLKTQIYYYGGSSSKSKKSVNLSGRSLNPCRRQRQS